MGTVFDEGLGELFAEVTRRQDALRESIGKVREVSATATSAKGSVRVTVDAHGTVTELTFTSSDYRTMPPAELSHVVLDTIGKARARAHELTKEALGGLDPAGLSVEDVMSGRVDLTTLMPEGPLGVGDALAL